MRRLIGLTRPHLPTLALALMAGMVALAAGLASPGLVRRLVDDGIVGGRRSVVWPLGLGVLALGTVRAAANFLRRFLAGSTSARIEASVRSTLFAHLQRLPVSFHDEWHTGQLLARMTSDLVSIRVFLGYALVFLTFVSITFVAVAITALRLDPLLATLTLGLVVPYLSLAIRFNRSMAGVAARSREAVGEVTDVIEESASGVRVLKAFGQEGRAVARLDAAAGRLMAVNLETVRVRGFYIPVLSLVPNLILAAVLGVGGMQVLRGRLSLGGLVAFNQYLLLLVAPLRFAGWMLAMGQEAVAAGARVFEVLDTPPAIRDEAGALDLAPAAGDVEFEGVTYRYPGGAAPALDDVSFHVAAGETVALVGKSGSGKSTVAGLLLRFVDPDSGTIRIDGHDIRGVKLPSLRRQIGVVLDEAVLFSASVRENISFGAPEADGAEVIAAARAAGAHGFISELPDGYDTAVGEHGLSLSGGQRQRVALARALVGSPRILVFDDPLSSVDVETEAEIEANLAQLLAGRTTFLIAHRASTVAMADRVLLLERGRVVAAGTHHELLQTDPAYRDVLAAELGVTVSPDGAEQEAG